MKKSLAKIALCLVIATALTASAFAQTTATTQPTPLETAKALMTKSKFAEALPILEGIVSSDKASAPKALVMTGECYKALRKWPKAIETYQKLMADYPNAAAPDKEVKLWVMDCLLANKEPDKALELKKELIPQFGPESWRVYHVLGRRYTWNHDPTKAIVELEKAVELGAASKNSIDFLDANRRLLHCYVEKKQADKTETLAAKLNQDYPRNSYEWNYELGRSYLAQYEFEKAIPALESASKTAPKTLVISKNISKALVMCYKLSGRGDKTSPLAETLAKERPDDPSWNWELGCSLMEKEQYDKAVPAFQKVVETSQKRWEIRCSQEYLGQCLFRCGKGKEAMEGIETYYKGKPSLWDEQLLVKSAVLFYGAKDDEGCLDSAQKLLAEVAGGKKSSLVATVRELMFKAYERTGRLDMAATVLEEMAASTKNPMWLARAGDDYFQTGKYTDARRVYKSVVDSSGISDDVRANCMYGLAMCYWDAGLKEAARRLMQQISQSYPTTEGGMKAQNTLYSWANGN